MSTDNPAYLNTQGMTEPHKSYQEHERHDSSMQDETSHTHGEESKISAPSYHTSNYNHP